MIISWDSFHRSQFYGSFKLRYECSECFTSVCAVCSYEQKDSADKMRTCNDCWMPVPDSEEIIARYRKPVGIFQIESSHPPQHQGSFAREDKTASFTSLSSGLLPSPVTANNSEMMRFAAGVPPPLPPRGVLTTKPAPPPKPVRSSMVSLSPGHQTSTNAVSSSMSSSTSSYTSSSSSSSSSSYFSSSQSHSSSFSSHSYQEHSSSSDFSSHQCSDGNISMTQHRKQSDSSQGQWHAPVFIAPNVIEDCRVTEMPAQLVIVPPKPKKIKAPKPLLSVAAARLPLPLTDGSTTSQLPQTTSDTPGEDRDPSFAAPQYSTNVLLRDDGGDEGERRGRTVDRDMHEIPRAVSDEVTAPALIIVKENANENGPSKGRGKENVARGMSTYALSCDVSSYTSNPTAIANILDWQIVVAEPQVKRPSVVAQRISQFASSGSATSGPPSCPKPAGKTSNQQKESKFAAKAWTPCKPEEARIAEPEPATRVFEKSAPSKKQDTADNIDYPVHPPVEVNRFKCDPSQAAKSQRKAFPNSCTTYETNKNAQAAAALQGNRPKLPNSSTNLSAVPAVARAAPTVHAPLPSAVEEPLPIPVTILQQKKHTYIPNTAKTTFIPNNVVKTPHPCPPPPPMIASIPTPAPPPSAVTAIVPPQKKHTYVPNTPKNSFIPNNTVTPVPESKKYPYVPKQYVPSVASDGPPPPRITSAGGVLVGSNFSGGEAAAKYDIPVGFKGPRSAFVSE